MTTAVADREITIEGNKAVSHLTLPIPQGGGLVVIRGDNGCGKTEALNACRAVLGSKDAKSALRTTDGEKSGSVEGLGVTISIGRSNREKGELTVASIEDTLDIADLVDPGIDDLNAADSKRLKSLLKVAGAKGDITLFGELIKDVEIDGDVIKERDLIKQAGGVKRTLEKLARSAEAAADGFTVEATAALKATEGIDLEVECDEQKLQLALKSAIQRDTQIDERLKAAEDAADARRKAQAALDKAKADYKGQRPEDALIEANAAQELETEKSNQVRSLREQLAAAESELKVCVEQTKAKNLAYELAVNHQNTITHWQEQIDRDIPQAPSADEIQAAEQAMQAAQDAVVQGARIRLAKAAVQESDDLTAKAKDRRKQAEHWRESAKGVDEVLSQQVAALGCSITVGDDDKGLRLMVTHPKRGLIYFSELSAGEKWATVIPIAVKAVGEDGVFVIPQTAYEGLQPRVRKQIVELLKGSHVTAITAECADGEIKAEVAA